MRLPRSEVSPLALARYLLSAVPFALLIPVDLLAMAYAPNLFRLSPHEEIAARFAKAGKITILATQMTWVVGNLEDCHPVEIFASAIRTPAPVTGFGSRTYSSGETPTPLDEADLEEVEGTVPRTLEAWAKLGPNFPGDGADHRRQGPQGRALDTRPARAYPNRCGS